jgi:hypothetical protein
MIKKAGILALAVCLFLVLLSPGLIQAQGELTILNSSAEAEFPSRLNFALSAESDVNIRDIRLHYTVDRAGFAQVTSEVYITFAPSTVVDIEWSWDMRRTGGLPPGTSLEYWWTVEDAKGVKLETAPIQVQFEDTRHYWQNLTEGKVTIYWYEGGIGAIPFAQKLMAAAQQALDRLAEDTGAYLKKPVKLYIYASSQDLQGAMIYPQEWTGGAAFTRYGIIVIGIPASSLNWGKRAIAHELTHLVIHQVTLNPYNELPTWLDEGLAMHTEGPLEPEYISFLDKAKAEGGLISVRSLSSPFSARTAQSVLSYAQSYSLVDFLIQEYGQAKMLELLNIFRQGIGFDAALERVYGFDMDSLDAEWRERVTAPVQTPAEKEAHPAPAGLLAILGTGFKSSY